MESFSVSTVLSGPRRSLQEGGSIAGGHGLKKQKSVYKVLTPSIKPPYKFLWELMTHICVIGW